MARDVGKKGEAVLHDWTADVGIVTNKSTDHDATGWDFILEWPVVCNPDATTIPLDQALTPLKCLVQVKSTDTKINRWPVTLKNWLYLVRNPLPTFFIVLHFDGKSQCQRAHLVHVGEHYISETQRRLRLASTPNKSSKKGEIKLNKATMQFSWSQKDLIPSLDGHGLQSGIFQYIQQGIDEYLKWKQSICRSVGYENGHGRVDFTVLLPTSIDAEQHIVDFDIGLVSHLEIDRGEFFDERFGIPVLTNKFESGGRLEALPTGPPEKGQITIWTSSRNKKLFLDCDVYLPRSFGKFVDSSKLRARFDAGYLTFVVPLGNSSSTRMNFKLPRLKEQAPLRKLYESACVFLAIQAALDDSASIKLSVSCEDKNLRHGELQLTSNIPPSLIKWAHLIENAWVVARHFDIESKVRVSVQSLGQQNLELFLAKSYLVSDPQWFKICSWLEDDERFPEEKCCIPRPAVVNIGEYKIQVAGGFIGDLRFNGNRRENQYQYEVVTNSTCKCFERILYPGDGPGESYEELTGHVSAHHEHEMRIAYVKFASKDQK